MVGAANTQATEQPRTLAEKVWDTHVVRPADGEPDLLYIDLHLVHEVTSPQAFDGHRSRRCAATVLSSASVPSRSAMWSRASCTSSGRSWASPTHGHSWRVRGSRLRHRYERGRARPCHTDAAPGSPEDHGGDLYRRVAARRDGDLILALIAQVGTGACVAPGPAWSHRTRRPSHSSRTGRTRRRAPRGTRRWSTGGRCAPTTARSSTPR